MLVAADIVVISKEKGINKVLLIQRNNDPFKGMWALPGGFVEENEEILNAAKRELFEETGINVKTKLYEIGIFDNPKRDPRGRVISVAYLAFIKKIINPKASSDAKNAQWHSLKRLPPLAFDHKEIIKRAHLLLKKLQKL